MLAQRSQRYHRRIVERYDTLLMRLRVLLDVPARAIEHDRACDRDLTCVEINVAPPQRTELPTSRAARGSEAQVRRQLRINLVRACQQRRDLRRQRRREPGLRASRGI